VDRIFRINKKCVVGASGEISDFQQIQKYLDELTMDDFTAQDGIELTPKEVHSYLTRVMYNRRNKCAPRPADGLLHRHAAAMLGSTVTSPAALTAAVRKRVTLQDPTTDGQQHFTPSLFCRFDPLWNSLVVAGLELDGAPFCGMVSMIGVQYSDACVCTGFASHLALPLLRQYQKSDMSEADAAALMKEALRVRGHVNMQHVNQHSRVLRLRLAAQTRLSNLRNAWPRVRSLGATAGAGVAEACKHGTHTRSEQMSAGLLA
jgi:ribosomal protein S15P/S13E